ncbi:hypothetical protein COCNU_12G004160 [Cocos nucifera]|uniref:Protein TIC 20 n=1 Tax=Cocos nucifera TaxID=13894 RepID=A0A8K0IRT6_COCNU|nr:hypothetical protein COCNU_12G004160 [Cocos nucifera]
MSASLLRRDHGSLADMMPVLPKRHAASPRSRVVPRASKDVPYSFRYPPMTKKPRWWWRTLACIPYLMPLHETWMYAETAYHLHPFLEDFEYLTYPFLGFIGSLPAWFLMAYFFVAYLGVVRRKEWPHFFRFHVVMGMLLEIALQVVGTVSRWMPLALYWGKLGMHFWAAVAFAYLFTVLECISSWNIHDRDSVVASQIFLFSTGGTLEIIQGNKHHGPPKVNIWEDPLSPSKWKEEHFVLASLAGWFVLEHHGPPKVNIWEDPLSPSKWKEEHFVLASLAGWFVLGYGGYKLFSGKKEKKEENTSR